MKNQFRIILLITAVPAAILLSSCDGFIFSNLLAPVMTLNYDGNGSIGGSLPAGPEIYHKGDAITVPGNTGSLVKEGNTFTGWNAAPDGTGTAYVEGDVLTIEMENITLYAVWQPAMYQVSFNTKGGSEIASQRLVHGSLVADPGTPSYDPYTFNGWFTDYECTSRWDFSSDTVTGSMTLYAQWSGSEELITLATGMTTARSDHAAAAANGKLYVFGGNSLAAAVSVEEYDPSTNIWTYRDYSWTNRWYHSAVTVNNVIYVIGGYSGSTLDSVEKYDPSTDSWTTAASMPSARRNFSAVTANGKIYVYGGNEVGVGTSDTVLEYDPSSDTWTYKTGSGLARQQLSGAMIDNILYFPNGYDGTSTYYQESQYYNPATDTWSTTAAMALTNAISYHSTTAVNGKIYRIGGYNGTVEVDEINEYDPLSNTWTMQTVKLPVPLQQHASASIGAYIYITGGTSGGDQTAVYRYLPPAP